MSSWKSHYLFPVAASALCAAMALAFAGGFLAGRGLWPVRIGLLSASLASVIVLVVRVLKRDKENQRAAGKYLAALCELDVCDLRHDGGPDAPPPLPADNPWSAVAGRVCEVLEESRRRTRELKLTRTAWEVRYRRAATELEQIRALFSGLAEPILAIDNYGELVFANRSAEELFERDVADTKTRTLSRLVPCQKLVHLLTATSRRRTSGDRTDEVEIVDQNGNSHWYRVTVCRLAAGPEEDEGQEPASGGVVAVLRDIGDQRALQKRNAEFVSAVSHEMKTPLAGIKAYVELLLDGDAEDEETREEFLEVINGQADRLRRLVDNMLNLARIEAGVVIVSKQTRSLNELLEEAIHVVQPAAEAKRIELVADLSPLYLGVLADRDMLLQSAINLLSNAIKYTPDQGRVILRSRLEDGQVRFEVQDTGVGLNEEDCQRVFEKFYRVKKDKNMAGGTGLGLPLAKHIVEDVHGGRLTVESSLGTGSTFAVTMPSAGQLT